MAANSVTNLVEMCKSVNEGGSSEPSKAGLSRPCRAVSRVLEELYWKRPVFYYLLFPAERSRLGHLITVYYSKTAADSQEERQEIS